MDPPLALVVDRDVSLRAAVREALEQLSISTLGASTEAEARERLRDRPVGVIVLGDCGGNAALSKRIRDRVSAWNDEYGSSDYRLSFSIGCSVWNGTGDILDTIREADLAMYEDKQGRRPSLP